MGARKDGAREGGWGGGRKSFLSPRLSPSLAHFFQAPATQPLLRVLQALATLECEKKNDGELSPNN